MQFSHFGKLGISNTARRFQLQCVTVFGASGCVVGEVQERERARESALSSSGGGVRDTHGKKIDGALANIACQLANAVMQPHTGASG